MIDKVIMVWFGWIVIIFALELNNLFSCMSFILVVLLSAYYITKQLNLFVVGNGAILGLVTFYVLKGVL